MKRTNRHLWALAELEGILSGIAADGIIVIEETRYLEYWLMLNNDLASLFPFSFFITMVHSILNDGVITTSESKELIHFIQVWKAPDALFGLQGKSHPAATSIQVLIRSLPINKPLTPIQVAVFKNIIHVTYELEETQATTMLRLLGKILDDQIISADEQEAILKLFEAE